LASTIQLGQHHPALNQQRDEQQQVVARDTGHAGSRHQKHRRKKQAGKEAGPRFLEAEIAELHQKTAKARQVRIRFCPHQPVVQRQQSHRHVPFLFDCESRQQALQRPPQFYVCGAATALARAGGRKKARQHRALLAGDWRAC
jgi:hypothetical protein